MNEHSDEAWLEALLVDFYRTEIPAEFRQPGFEAEPTTVAAPARTVRPAAPPVPVAGSAPARGSRGFAVLGLAAACLVALIVSLPGRAEPSNEDEATSVADVEPAKPAPSDDGPEFTLTIDDLFVERYDERVETFGAERIETNGGPVELRTVRETTNVSVVDPETGTGVDVTSEVLDIEIVPIEDESDETPAEFPQPRDDAPLPPEFGTP